MAFTADVDISLAASQVVGRPLTHAMAFASAIDAWGATTLNGTAPVGCEADRICPVPVETIREEATIAVAIASGAGIDIADDAHRAALRVAMTSAACGGVMPPRCTLTEAPPPPSAAPASARLPGRRAQTANANELSYRRVREYAADTTEQPPSSVAGLQASLVAALLDGPLAEHASGVSVRSATLAALGANVRIASPVAIDYERVLARLGDRQELQTRLAQALSQDGFEFDVDSLTLTEHAPAYNHPPPSAPPRTPPPSAPPQPAAPMLSSPSSSPSASAPLSDIAGVESQTAEGSGEEADTGIILAFVVIGVLLGVVGAVIVACVCKRRQDKSQETKMSLVTAGDVKRADLPDGAVTRMSLDGIETYEIDVSLSNTPTKHSPRGAGAGDAASADEIVRPPADARVEAHVEQRA